jgi:hypothetical protein
MDYIFTAIFNFHILNWTCQHNRTATLAEAAITASDSTRVKAAWDRELHYSTMTVTIKPIFFHLSCPLYYRDVFIYIFSLPQTQRLLSPKTKESAVNVNLR